MDRDHCSAFPANTERFFLSVPTAVPEVPPTTPGLCGPNTAPGKESPEPRTVSGSVFGVSRQPVPGERGPAVPESLRAVPGVPEGGAGVPEGGVEGP